MLRSSFIAAVMTALVLTAGLARGQPIPTITLNLATPTRTATPVGTATPTITLNLATPTPTRTVTPTQTPVVATPTLTVNLATPTPTRTATATRTATPVGTATPTLTINVATPTVSITLPPLTPTPTATPLCGASPATSCRTPTVSQKAQLQLKDQTDDNKDGLLWRWRRGAATTKADFGSPPTMTDYALCIYDGSPRLVSSSSAPADDNCNASNPRPCWRETSLGFNYQDKDRTPDGLERILLKSGAAGKAQLIVKGRGVNLNMPMLPITQPVRVQLRNSNGQCWEAVYSAPATRNEAGPPGQFKDKGD